MVNIRNNLKQLWTDTCTIINTEEIEDQKDHSTSSKEVIVLKDEPCKLSFQTITTANSDQVKAELVLKAKLFLTNEVNIKPGSKIEVIRENRTFLFTSSGLPAIYHWHQEIMLDSEEEYA